MITEKDIKVLNHYRTRAGKTAYWASILVPIFFLVVAIINFHYASAIGSHEGINLAQLFTDWEEGIDIDSQYSGLYLAAMECFTNALLQMGLAIFSSVFAYAYHSRRKMDERILETLKSNKIIAQ